MTYRTNGNLAVWSSGGSGYSTLLVLVVFPQYVLPKYKVFLNESDPMVDASRGNL
jgi:hypothetical protein